MQANSTVLSSCQASLAAFDSLGLHLATGQQSTLTLWSWDTVAWLQIIDISTGSDVTQVSVDYCAALRTAGYATIAVTS